MGMAWERDRHGLDHGTRHLATRYKTMQGRAVQGCHCSPDRAGWGRLVVRWSASDMHECTCRAAAGRAKHGSVNDT